MKTNIFKRAIISALALVMIVGTLAGCGSSDGADKKGTIMWLANISSGNAYDNAIAYLEAFSEKTGYDYTVVYGDPFNDPAGNLSAVTNGMTSDVVGLILSQDGGVSDIMAEYPELFVVGYNTDMRTVFGEDGADASLLDNEKFLGIIVDGHADGAVLGENRANYVIEQGYKKVATIMFPGFAYPNLPEADAAFRATIEEYNETAAEPIEIVGDALTLMFEPLPESYFLEAGHGDLDAIVGFCAGTQFVYPTMKTAIANGTCSADTKLVTGGFDTNADLIADIGGEGIISQLVFSPAENIGYTLLLLDKAISGEMFDDFKAERVDSLEYIINTQEDAVNVTTKAFTGTSDISKLQITLDELYAVESYADLKALYMSDQLTVSSLAE